MTGRVLTDDIWLQIQETMQFYGCYHSKNSKNSKNITEAILCKRCTGTTQRVFLKAYVLGKWLTIALIVA